MPRRKAMPPVDPAKKEKMNFDALKRLIGYCRGYIPAILGAMLLSLGAAVTSLIGPQVISDVMNTLTEGVETGVDMSKFVGICRNLLLIYALGAFMSYGEQIIMAEVSQRTNKRLRSDIDRKINLIPLDYFDSTTIGDTLSVVTNDVDVLGQTFAQTAAQLISALVLFVGVLWKMFSTNVTLTLASIGTSLLGLIGMGVILAKSQKFFVRKQQDLGDMNGQVEEVYTNHKIVSAFGGRRTEKVRFEENNGRLYEDDWKSQTFSGMMGHIMSFAGSLTYVMIFVVGVNFILRGDTEVTLGTIMAFVLYAKMFSQPLTTLAQSMTSVQQASAAAGRVFALLDHEELSDESGKTAALPEVRGAVSFRELRFGYAPDTEIIHGFSAEIEPGQKVAIVGPTGAGKTTLVNLLMRFYELNSGDIVVDGVSIRDMKREKVHDLFDMILQDTWLFEGTIRENLVYNKENVPDAALDRACAAVGLKKFIETLPNGYETVLNEKLELSEGQKQQLTIARAMVRDSPLLILDEATSSVDTRTELLIQEAMDELTVGRTSFVIAHRLSTIRNADVIFVLDQGNIVEHGTHAELLAKGGFYAELYNSQFESVAP